MKEFAENRAAAGQHAEGTIYVVDDEPILLKLISVILERLGYVVRTFESPELALQAFQGAEPKPVLIITDYAMHAMNGLQLAAACRRIQPKQKVLLVSGSVETDFLDRSMVHPDAFLGKPYLPSQLIDAVNSVLAAEPCMR